MLTMGIFEALHFKCFCFRLLDLHKLLKFTKFYEDFLKFCENFSEILLSFAREVVRKKYVLFISTLNFRLTIPHLPIQLQQSQQHDSRYLDGGACYILKSNSARLQIITTWPSFLLCQRLQMSKKTSQYNKQRLSCVQT